VDGALWPEPHGGAVAPSAAPNQAELDSVFSEIDSRAAEAGNVGPIDRLAYQFLTTYLPEDILTKPIVPRCSTASRCALRL